MKETDVLLVGFGFSAIPLLRELDASGVNYTIISEKDGSVWTSLVRSGGLDFDLVSSYYTSFYTFDLVDDFSEDRYPTAQEFYDMHLRYYRKYQDRIIVDRVTLIENKSDHSIVHTASGDRFKAKHVVVSTAFRRRVVDSLTTFDCNIHNKTGCGNGILSAGEICDDGNRQSGDGCSADCTALCGNGTTEPGEECDDGNLVDGDGCDVNCTVSGCGNRILMAGEACDDGNAVDGDGCSSACEPEALDVSGTWQVSTLFVGFQTTRFLSIVAGSPPGSFTFGDASICGTRAAGTGPEMAATCPITSSNSTGTALGNAFSLPDSGWYVDDVTLAAPAGDEDIIRLVENVRLIGRIEGQNGRAERIAGREYRFGDDYDTSGALRGTGSASNPAVLTMVMRRADAPMGTNVTVSPADGATVTFAQVVGAGEAGTIPRADATGTLPSGFVVTGSSVVNFKGYVDVLTTASPTGAFVTCMAYPDLDDDGFVDLRTPALSETQLRILHAENGSFVDRTVSLDLVHNIICAQTSSLSEFVVGTGPTGATTSSTTTTTHVGSSSTTSTVATSTSTTTTLPSVSTCGTSPAPGCLSAFSRKASIALAAGATPASDKLTWKWASSGAVAQASFGDPAATTGYDLCVYDQRGLLTTARVPPGGQCGVKPCWKASSSGAKYTNKALTPDGVLTVSLKAGAAGRGKIGLKAEKEGLRLPTLPLVPKVTVQLRRVDTGACWGATYDSATVNVATKFKAKSD